MSRWATTDTDVTCWPPCRRSAGTDGFLQDCWTLVSQHRVIIISHASPVASIHHRPTSYHPSSVCPSSNRSVIFSDLYNYRPGSRAAVGLMPCPSVNSFSKAGRHIKGHVSDRTSDRSQNENSYKGPQGQYE